MKLSIYTAAHRNDIFFKWCADSIIHQNYDDWEWIILDNSPKRDLNLMLHDCYGKIDERIKVYNEVTGKKEIGFLKATAMELCTGKYLIELDSDNILHEGALLKVFETILKNPQADFIYSDYIEAWFDAEGIFKGHSLADPDTGIDKMKWNGQDGVVVKGNQFLTVNALSKGIFPMGLRIYRKDFSSLVGGVDKTIPVMEDFDHILKIVAYNGHIIRLSNVCVINIHHTENSQMKRSTQYYNDAIHQTFEKYASLLERRKEERNLVELRYIPLL